MDFLLSAIDAVGRVIEVVLLYVENHHWVFAFAAGGYVFYLHDKAVHARFDALEKRIDEVRTRLAVEWEGAEGNSGCGPAKPGPFFALVDTALPRCRLKISKSEAFARKDSVNPALGLTDYCW